MPIVKIRSEVGAVDHNQTLTSLAQRYDKDSQKRIIFDGELHLKQQILHEA